jgi:hypothetical protein
MDLLLGGILVRLVALGPFVSGHGAGIRVVGLGCEGHLKAEVEVPVLIRERLRAGGGKKQKDGQAGK